VGFDSKLAFLVHMKEKVNKAYSMLSIIKRNVIHLDKHSFVLLYTAMGYVAALLCVITDTFKRDADLEEYGNKMH